MRCGRFARGESGVSLIESLVALVIVSSMVIAGLSGLATSSKATIIADEQGNAESLAHSQMEWIKRANYIPGASTYTAAEIPASYADYSVNIIAASLRIPDDGVQKITVTIEHSGRQVLKLEDYKVSR
jgi:type II secretory pathway pseudopilin PulG